MKTPTVDFTLSQWQAGKWSLTAKTNWPNHTIGLFVETSFIFDLTKEGRKWTARCKDLTFRQDGFKTLRLARLSCQAYLVALTGVGLQKLEIWIDCQGSLCIGGNYRDYYIFASKDPGQIGWVGRARLDGQIGFSLTGSPARYVISTLKQDVDQVINPVTAASLKRELAELPF